MKVLTPKRGPLFGKRRIVSKPMAPRVQVPQGMQHKVPIQNKGIPTQKIEDKKYVEHEEPKGFQKLLENKKILLSAGILFISLIAIVVVVAVSLSYTSEVVEKSSLLIPFMFRKKD